MTKTKDEDLQVASPLPVLLSGLINGVVFCLVCRQSLKNGVGPSSSQIALLNIGFVLSTVVIAILFFRRSIQTEIKFSKLLIAGWLASIIFGLVVFVFYKQFLSVPDMIIPSFTQMVISYSSMGLVLSALVSFFISRIK